MKIKNLVKPIIAILICQAAGLAGSLFTYQSITSWYQYLNKPSFNPPNFIFGPVWTLLYTLMGISLYLIWQKGPKNPKTKFALRLFGLQLFLNFLWTIIFFGLKNPGLAFVEIVFLWLSILLVIQKFWQIKKEAAILLIPYILWVSFAALLNYNIYILN